MDADVIGLGGSAVAGVLAIGGWAWRSLDGRLRSAEREVSAAMPREAVERFEREFLISAEVRREAVDRRLSQFDREMLTKGDLRDALVAQTAAMQASEARIMAAIQAGRRRTDAAD